MVRLFLRREKMVKSGKRPPFGYKPLEDGVCRVNEPSATIVRRIYEDHLKEIYMRQIAKNFNAEGIKSPAGIEWEHSYIKVILKNKRYCGNENYEKVISEETFLRVQYIRENGFDKPKLPLLHEGVWEKRYSFTDIITCGHCGERYTRAVYCSGKPWQRRIWRCKGSLKKGECKCRNTDIPEKELKDLFVKAFNEVLRNKDKYLKTEGRVKLI